MDKNWDPVYKYESSPEKTGDGKWHIKNVRDFSYQNNKQNERWLNISLDVSSLSSAWFYVASLRQFGALQNALAHTCIGFSFQDNSEVIFSLEARKERGEEYKPLTKGMVGQYELIYLYTTKDDLVGFRKIQRGQGLERYPLTVSKEEIQKILEQSLKATNSNLLEPSPTIYNSITNQCTNALVRIMNQGLEKTIPWHFYWHLTGLSPRLLAKRGIIDLSKKEIV